MNQISIFEKRTPYQIDSSSIIQNLNSSIEDLLNKIQQVHYQHHINSYSESKIPIKMPQKQNRSIRIIKTNKVQEDLHQLKNQQISRMRSKTANNNNLHIQVQQSLKEVNFSITDYNKGPFLWAQSSLYKKDIQQCHKYNPQLDIQCLKKPQKKITSLFTDDSIREVKESMIYDNELIKSWQINYKNKNRTRERVCNVTIQQEKRGLKLSDFIIGKQVGSGKFGQVYLCMHKETRTIYALKKIFKSIIKQYNLQDQLCLELKILYFLNHPNIVKLYSHFSDDYHIFLLMEYVEGGQLMLRLKSDEQYTSIIIEQVTNAIGYLHKNNIIHRDIKPQNIVVSFEKTAKICDFGWATLCNKKTMRKTFCGTLDYISPEMKEFSLYNRKIDLWSLGILTYQMLVGHAPFKDQTTKSKKQVSLNRQWNWEIEYSASISGIAQSFMRNLLKINPNQRASITFCKNHYFIRKYKQLQLEKTFEFNLNFDMV